MSLAATVYEFEELPLNGEDAVYAYGKAYVEIDVLGDWYVDAIEVDTEHGKSRLLNPRVEADAVLFRLIKAALIRHKGDRILDACEAAAASLFEDWREMSIRKSA